MVVPVAEASAAITASMRSPATVPGATQFTLMPAGPSSAAQVRVSPSTAHLDAEYAERIG